MNEKKESDQESEYTRARASRKLAEEFRKRGMKGETYEDIIWRLIEHGDARSE